MRGSSRSATAAVPMPAARVVLVTTCIAGALTGGAELIPAAIRLESLVLLLAVWTAVVVWGAVRLAVYAVRSASGTRDWLLNTIAFSGAAVATLSISLYGLIRWLGGRDALSWHIDWRGHWNHAQAIARYGSTEHALDYAGAPIGYHVGPSWLAGAVESVLGTGMHETLFIVFPVVATLATFIALLFLVQQLAGMPGRASAAAAGIFVTLPAINLMYPPVVTKLLAAPVKLLLQPDTWVFSTIMLNSLLGFAAGTAGMVFLLRRDARWWETAAGIAGLGSIVVIKPQFFVGLGAITGIIALGMLAGGKAFGPRTFRPLLASMGALGFAVLFQILVPGFEGVFGAPRLDPGGTVYTPARFGLELAYMPALLALAAGGLWLIARRRAPAGRDGAGSRPYILALASGIALVLLGLGLFLLEFPLQPELVQRALAIGEPEYIFGNQRNLIQSLIVVRYLLAAGAAVLLVHAALQQRRGVTLLLLLCGVAITLVPVPHLIYYARHPDRAYEYAEDRDLYAVLQSLPQGDELIVINDLADPADDHLRALNAELMTAYGGHRTFASNVRFQQWTNPDAPQRLHEHRVFFGSAWSPWHAQWLHRNGITHVLIHDRCDPVWNGNDIPSLTRVAQTGAWTLFSFDRTQPQPAAAAPGDLQELDTEYGFAPCLRPR